MMRRTTTSILTLLVLTACGRKGARSSDFDSATGAALTSGAATQTANTPKVAHVAGIELGHSLDRHNMIFGGVSNQFRTGDSILVAVRGLYLAVGADVSARIRQKNATLDSAGAKAGPADTTGYTYVGLRFASGRKWTKGLYQVEVFLNGKFQLANEFSFQP